MLKIIEEIHKTKRLNKLLRLSIILIENDLLQEFKSVKEKIMRFENLKNFQKGYIIKILIEAVKQKKTEFITYILNNLNVKLDLESYISLIFYSTKKYSVFKIIFHKFKKHFNLEIVFTTIFILLTLKTDKYSTEKIFNLLSPMFINHLEELYKFLINFEDKNLFYKEKNNEFSLSDFIVKFDSYNQIIRHHNEFKIYLSYRDKPFLDNLYMNYLKKNIENF
jgi:hypothetical protein